MQLSTFQKPLVRLSSLALATVVLSACTSTSLTRAPVDDRSRTVSSSTAPTPTPTRPLIGQGNRGKPGFYEVQRGDTLYSIGRRYGRTVSDLAYWNGLSAPYIIEIGDVLRVAADGSAAAPVVQAAPKPSTPAPAAQQTISLSWPATGPILQQFDGASNKGIDIAGSAGDVVLAASDGEVVYAGNALRGYGNLVILKHGSTFVTAYAHNQRILVQEKQVVKRGQKIAEMGQTEADRVKLHFELRKNNSPINPMSYLPPR